MSKQPEALRLADVIDSSSSNFYAESSMRYDHELAMTVGAAADELRRLHAVNGELLEALSSIDVYLSDTISGRVNPDPATYKQWLIDGVIEARNRAKTAITKAEAV